MVHYCRALLAAAIVGTAAGAECLLQHSQRSFAADAPWEPSEEPSRYESNDQSVNTVEVTFSDMGPGTCQLLDGATPAHQERPGQAAECETLCMGAFECQGYSANGLNCLLFYEGPLQPGGGLWGGDVHCHIDSRRSSQGGAPAAEASSDSTEPPAAEDALRQELAEVREELSLSRSAQNAQQMQQEIARLREEVVRASNSTAVVQGRLADAQKFEEELKSQADAAKRDATVARGKLQAVTDQLAAQEHLSAKTDSESVSLKQKLTEIDRDAAKWKDKANALTEELARTRSAKEATVGASSEVQKRLSEAIDSANAWRSKALELGNELAKAGKSNSQDLREKLAKASHDVADWKSRAADLSSELQRLKQKPQKNNAEVQAEAEVARLRKQLQQSQQPQQSRGTDAASEELHTKLNHAVAVARKWRTEAQKLQHQLNELAQHGHTGRHTATAHRHVALDQ